MSFDLDGAVQRGREVVRAADLCGSPGCNHRRYEHVTGFDGSSWCEHGTGDDCDCLAFTEPPTEWATPLTAAELRAAGLTEPPTVAEPQTGKIILSIDDLVELPIGTIIVADTQGIGLPYTRYPEGWRGIHGKPHWHPSHLPIRIAYFPGEPIPKEDDRG